MRVLQTRSAILVRTASQVSGLSGPWSIPGQQSYQVLDCILVVQHYSILFENVLDLNLSPSVDLISPLCIPQNLFVFFNTTDAALSEIYFDITCKFFFVHFLDRIYQIHQAAHLVAHLSRSTAIIISAVAGIRHHSMHLFYR